jgi:hypothetical protein
MNLDDKIERKRDFKKFPPPGGREFSMQGNGFFFTVLALTLAEIAGGTVCCPVKETDALKPV